MEQRDIAAMFRQGELSRRQVRRAHLINEVNLLMEQLSPDEQLAHKQAIERLQEGRLALEKEMTPGYWKRLWFALLDK